MDSPITVLVTGATGRQGGAVARALLERGHKVRALTRKKSTRALEQLKNRRAEIVRGRFDDAASLARAMRSVDAVFAMGTPFEVGATAEIRQGRALVDAAKKCKVTHLVYSSVASANRMTGVPYFDSKHGVETYLRSSGVPHSIVAPVFFMENFQSTWVLPALHHGKLEFPLPAQRKLQQVALGDLAELVVLIMERRDAFVGERIEVASDELTCEHVASILSRLRGCTIECIETPLTFVERVNPDRAALFRWLDRVGFEVDIPGLHKRYPEIGWRHFEEWALVRDWSDSNPKSVGPWRRRGRDRPPYDAV